MSWLSCILIAGVCSGGMWWYFVHVYVYLCPRRRLARAWYTVLAECCFVQPIQKYWMDIHFWIILDDIDIGWHWFKVVLVQLFTRNLCFCSQIQYFLQSRKIPDPLATYNFAGFGGRGIKRSLENAASQSLLLGRSRDEGFLAEKVIRSVSPTHVGTLGFAVVFLAFSPPKTTWTLIKKEKCYTNPSSKVSSS